VLAEKDSVINDLETCLELERVEYRNLQSENTQLETYLTQKSIMIENLRQSENA